jgi:hypothetical protein
MLFGFLTDAVSWMDAAGLFVMLAGFVVGLGAATVIDVHGFLGRRSSYWTEATTRTHKVTKPLIWIGIGLTVLGGFVLYRDAEFAGIPMVHAITALVLVLNGCFLSFRVSPFLLRHEAEGRAGELLPVSWQRAIAVSFVVSFVGWWGALFLLAVYVLGR